MTNLNDFRLSPQEERANNARSRALLIANEEFVLSSSTEGKATAKVTINGREEAIFIGSLKFRKHLQRRYFERFGLTLQKRDLDDLIELLAARAEHSAAVPTAHRITHLGDGTALLDTGNESGDVLEIASGSWKSKPNPGVPFVRPEGYRPLAKPVRQENLPERFQRFFNVTSAQFVVLLVWLIVLLTSPGPYPILNIRGECSFELARFLRNMVDPNSVPIRGVPRYERDLMVAIERLWIVVIQLSEIRGWFNEWLARMLTGAGFVTRRNYSDDEAITFAGLHPVVLVGTSDSPHGAVGESTLTIQLPHVEPALRRLPSATTTELAVLESGFFAYVLDAAASTRLYDDYTPTHLPQMSEFYTIGSRAELGLLWADNTFAKAYAAARLADSPALIAVLEYGLTYRRWTGSATSLWQSITAQLTPASRNTNWPADPAALGKLLHDKGALLAEFGLVVKFWRANGRSRDRTIILEAVEVPTES